MHFFTKKLAFCIFSGLPKNDAKGIIFGAKHHFQMMQNVI